MKKRFMIALTSIMCMLYALPARADVVISPLLVGADSNVLVYAAIGVVAVALAVLIYLIIDIRRRGK